MQCEPEDDSTVEDGPGSTVVGRLEAILASFDGSDHALALSEISHRVGLPKSTVHRLANQLCSVGWLERNSGGYRVGLRLLELGSVALKRTGLREVAFKHIYSLALKTGGLATHLAILDRGEVVYLDRIAMTRFNLPSRVGGRAPAYCTALGKAMLAFADQAGQDSALADMPRRTEFTITDPRVMQAELETIRRTGVAYDREEAYRGLCCVAAPIRSGGRTIGAVSVTGPIARMQAHSLVHDVRSAALAVSSGDFEPAYQEPAQREPAQREPAQREPLHRPPSRRVPVSAAGPR
jgi:DNA-binding IclR family transcriptional regulator